MKSVLYGVHLNTWILHYEGQKQETKSKQKKTFFKILHQIWKAELTQIKLLIS